MHLKCCNESATLDYTQITEEQYARKDLHARSYPRSVFFYAFYDGCEALLLLYQHMVDINLWRTAHQN